MMFIFAIMLRKSSLTPGLKKYFPSFPVAAAEPRGGGGGGGRVGALKIRLHP